MKPVHDIIIIGAGVSGCAIARELSRRRADILVLEKAEDVCCGTSKANSAIVHAGFDAAAGSLMARLNVEGNRRMPALAKELDFAYRQNGSLVLCLAEADRPALQRLYENGLANGVEGLRLLDQAELRRREPNVAPQAVAALWAPTGGIVCPFGLTFALAENAARNGVAFCFDTGVQRVAPRLGGGWQVHTDRGVYETRAVVNAAGVYADVFHNQVSDQKLHITPRRGEYLLLDRSCGGHVRHTVFQLPGQYGKGVLVTPTVHGNLLIGPTADDLPPEQKDRTATTAAGLAAVREKAARSVQNIPWGQVITGFAGLRAHEQGHEFVLGMPAPGFFDCAGIESPGLSASPAIGALVAHQVTEYLELPPDPDFVPTRTGILDPRTLPPAEHAVLIARQPAYGAIVCRCETVTEGEILDAIRRTPGARSLDGVKRRTRAGMGRCQGGFCSPRVLALLARELGLPPQAVTKSGGASALLTGRTKDGLDEL